MYMPRKKKKKKINIRVHKYSFQKVLLPMLWLPLLFVPETVPFEGTSTLEQHAIFQ